MPLGRDASVLDLGCGDGSLFAYLRESRGVTGYGIEIDDAGVLAASYAYEMADPHYDKTPAGY